MNDPGDAAALAMAGAGKLLGSSFHTALRRKGVCHSRDSVPMVSSDKSVGRNDPCPCGSGKKFKKCCLGSQGLVEPLSGSPNDDAHDFAASAIDEPERDIPVDYHRRAGIRLPRAEAHAIFHAIVESQIADALLPVRTTVERLMAEGLDRHQALHAVGSVLAGHVYDLMRKSSADEATAGPRSHEDPNVAYFAELEALTAEQWLQSG